MPSKHPFPQFLKVDSTSTSDSASPESSLVFPITPTIESSKFLNHLLLTCYHTSISLQNFSEVLREIEIKEGWGLGTRLTCLMNIQCDVKPGVSSSAFREGSERVVCTFTAFEYLVRILLHIVNVTILWKYRGNSRAWASTWYMEGCRLGPCTFAPFRRRRQSKTNCT